jgi:sialic acid synthase SpsE
LSAISVGQRRIGEGAPVFVIAEIGYNFNTLEEAKSSIDAAARCGVDAVKFQTFRAETIASRGTHFPAEAGSQDQFEEFKTYELSEDAHRTLFDHARKRKVLPFSTPSYFDDVELLDRVGCELYKIGSDDLTNLPFHAFVARRGKPVIFSTGMGDLGEVDQTLRVYRAAGNRDVALLHCLSNYPIKETAFINLRAIPALRTALGAPVGFSDHTTGVAAALGAVALGACILEKHFTLDKALPAPDASFSADPPEMAALVRSVRELESALGDGVKTHAPTEESMRRDTRKSVIAKADLKKGDVLSPDKWIVKRPGTGVAPALAPLLAGRRLKRNVAADEPIPWEAVE